VPADEKDVAPITDRAAGCRERALKALNDLPPFSPVLDRLLATLSNESVSVNKVAEIIETDTVIAGNVLKLVNSALYGRSGTVNSVRHAVSLLGISKVRNSVFAMSISRVWSQIRAAPGWSMPRFNLHSVTCGLLCDALAVRAPVHYPEGAFSAGLFHDVGALLIAVGLPDEFQEIRHLQSTTDLSLLECEWNVLGFSHPELSAEALALWNLPPAIQSAVRFHHDPNLDYQPAIENEFRLSLVVRCASDYIKWAKIVADDTDSDTSTEEPFLPLGIERPKADFLQDFEAELGLLGGIFQ
jgi:HD-like signal output (HDOD) protein